ncbi:14397_t:CDS:2, partial [Funneliformis geosporum]
DKPSGITSHKVIEIIRKKLNIRKVGHAGTLDPLATGLLVIMIGKKLYQYARQGLTVAIPLRQVAIKSIKLVGYKEAENQIDIRVECSKGTYIRSLIKDIAEKMGTLATVKELRRIELLNLPTATFSDLAERIKPFVRLEKEINLLAQQEKQLNQHQQSTQEIKERVDGSAGEVLNSPVRRQDKSTPIID